MAQKTTEATVRECLLHVGIDDGEITGSSRLGDDLGFDSLDKIEFAMELEDRLKITLTDGEIDDMETVQQAIALVDKKKCVTA